MGQIHLDSESSVPIFQQIVESIERWILTGLFEPGTFLPSVRDFAVANKVNPNTVSKAYQVLQSEGLVETVRGRGLVVCSLNEKRKAGRKEVILRSKIKELLVLRRELHVTPQDLINLVQDVEEKERS